MPASAAPPADDHPGVGRRDAPVDRRPIPGDDVARFEELARTGSPALRAALIADYLPLAHRLARRFARRAGNADDMEQVAALGLVKAVDGFRPELGYSFVAYAVSTIVGELKRSLRDQGWAVRVPRRLQELHLTVQQEAEALTQELGRTPRPRDLARRLGVSEESVLEAAEAAHAYQAQSIDTGGEDGAPMVAPLASTDHGLSLVDDMVTVLDAFRRLPAREQRILRLRFLGDRTQTEIAREVGLSQMQISRLLSSSLDDLRRAAVDAPRRSEDGRPPRRPAAHRRPAAPRRPAGRPQATGRTSGDATGEPVGHVASGAGRRDPAPASAPAAAAGPEGASATLGPGTKGAADGCPGPGGALDTPGDGAAGGPVLR